MHGTGGVGSCDRAKQPDYGETTQQQEATSTLRKDSPQATSGRWNTSAHPERAGVTEEQVTARNATAAWGPPRLHQDDQGKGQEWIWVQRRLRLT